MAGKNISQLTERTQANLRGTDETLVRPTSGGTQKATLQSVKNFTQGDNEKVTLSGNFTRKANASANGEWSTSTAGSLNILSVVVTEGSQNDTDLQRLAKLGAWIQFGTWIVKVTSNYSRSAAVNLSTFTLNYTVLEGTIPSLNASAETSVVGEDTHRGELTDASFKDEVGTISHRYLRTTGASKNVVIEVPVSDLSSASNTEKKLPIAGAVKKYVDDTTSNHEQIVFCTDAQVTFASGIYTLTPSPAYSGANYEEGTQVFFEASASNTGSTQINISGKGNRTIIRENGGVLQAGDIVSGKYYHLAFDGIFFVMLNRDTGGSGGGGATLGSPQFDIQTDTTTQAIPNQTATYGYRGTSTAITPRSDASKFVVFVNAVIGSISDSNGGSASRVDVQIQRKIGSGGTWTEVSSKNYAGLYVLNTNPPFAYMYEDSPNTASPVQYRVGLRNNSASDNAHRSTANTERVWLRVREIVDSSFYKGDTGTSGRSPFRGAYSNDTQYLAGDMVAQNNILYYRKTAGSDSSFTAANWQSLRGADGTDGNDGNDGAAGRDAYQGIWVANKTPQYQVGDIITRSSSDSTLYSCLTANGDATFTSSKWQTLKGADGTDGTDGTHGTSGAGYVAQFKKRLATASLPSAPTGGSVSGGVLTPSTNWSATVPSYNSATEVVDITTRAVSGNTLQGSWSAPRQFTGSKGADGLSNLDLSHLPKITDGYVYQGKGASNSVEAVPVFDTDVTDTGTLAYDSTVISADDSAGTDDPADFGALTDLPIERVALGSGFYYRIKAGYSFTANLRVRIDGNSNLGVAVRCRYAATAPTTANLTTHGTQLFDVGTSGGNNVFTADANIPQASAVAGLCFWVYPSATRTLSNRRMRLDGAYSHTYTVTGIIGDDDITPDMLDADTDTKKTAFRTRIGAGGALTDSQIGDKAFSNPPSDLNSTEKTAVRNAVNAGGSAIATQSVKGQMSAADKTKLDGIATGAEQNVNADWSASSGDAQILNKPTIPAATPDASETVAGKVERATNAEASAGTDTTRYITPKQLKDYGGGISYEEKTANYTIVAGDEDKVIAYNSTNAGTFTLPDITGSVAVGWRVTIINYSGSALTIDPNGTDRILALGEQHFSGTEDYELAGGKSESVTLIVTSSSRWRAENVNKIATDEFVGMIKKSKAAENTAGTAENVYPDVAGVKSMIDTHAAANIQYARFTTVPTLSNADTDYDVGTVSITPSSTSKKILLTAIIHASVASNGFASLRIKKGSSIVNSMYYSGYASAGTVNLPLTVTAVDSPASASVQTYKMTVRVNDTTKASFNAGSSLAAIITAQEI